MADLTDRRPRARRLVDWGVAARALTGQRESGDRHVVEPFGGGVLAAVVDGLGHGGPAAAAAEAAVRQLTAHAHEPVVDLVRRSQEALLETRGAVMSLASFAAADRTLSWIGVGNVFGLLYRRGEGVRPSRPERLLLRAGVVGFQLPTLHAAVTPVSPGDTLVFATDGVRAEFDQSVDLGATPHALADRLLIEHGKPDDDALVLVVRFSGAAAS